MIVHSKTYRKLAPKGLVQEFLNHLRILLDVMLALHGAALIIVNLTKTPKDNEAVEQVYRVVECFAGIVTVRAKM